MSEKTKYFTYISPVNLLIFFYIYYNNILKVLYVQMPEKIECVFTKNHYCGKLTKIVF